MLKQIHLICYLESKGCKEVRQSSQGYYIMRNTDNDAISGIPVATSDDGYLKEETICNICNILGVQIPPSSEKELKNLMKYLKKDAEQKVKKIVNKKQQLP